MLIRFEWLLGFRCCNHFTLWRTKIANSALEVIRQAMLWMAAGSRVDLATVASTFGSSPRPVGSMAAIRDDGLMVGSLSGGCVEKHIVSQSRQRDSASTLTVTLSDEEAKQHGLLCGGRMTLLLESVTEQSRLPELLERLEQNRRTVRQVDIASGSVTLREANGKDRFQFNEHTLSNPIGSAHTLILIGANELARYCAEFSMAADFHVVIIEPRESFRASWPLAAPLPIDLLPDDGVKAYASDHAFSVVTLTHDPSLDDLALLQALENPQCFIGALGSRKSHDKRLKRLTALGADTRALDRINAPVGVSIGSRTSAEIAIAIVAELIRHRALG